MAFGPKAVIVTGGSQGIGAGVVKAFLARGYNVVANSRNIARSGAFEPADNLALIDGNIADAATAAAIAEMATSRFGSIDAIVYLTEADQVTGEILHVDGGAHVGSW